MSELTKLERLEKNVADAMGVILHSSFVRIDGYMYRVDGHIFEEEEKLVYLLDEDKGNELIYDLDDADDLKVLQNAEFYRLELIK